MILRESYAIAHQTSNFIMRTNRQYDDRFAQEGAKIGQSLDIRLPAKYVTRTGNTMSIQNHVERAVALPLATIKGVDLEFTQEQLTFSLEMFSDRVLRPAMSQLMADVEADAFSMYKRVANFVGVVTTTTGSGLTYRQFQQTGRYLTDNLAPRDGNRNMNMNPESTVEFSDAVKGLFQSASNIERQYVEGVVGRTGGFETFENTILPAHVSGTFTGVITVTTTAGAPGFSDGTGNAYFATTSINIDGTTVLALNDGDIFTIAGVNEVHPETKQDLGYLKRFTISADVNGTTTGTLALTPALIIGGAYANASAAALDGAVVTLHGPATGAAAITYGQNLAFHRDAFAWVTADLIDPSQFGAWGAREVMDNFSIRIWRDRDITNGNFPARLDIAYGFVPVYPEWACRHTHVRQ